MAANATTTGCAEKQWYEENVDLKNPIRILHSEDFFKNPTEDVAVCQIKRIASYNWMGSPKTNPIMVIPGEPRIYYHCDKQKLECDARHTGHRMVDRDELYVPKFMLDPIMLAVEECEKDRDEKIDYRLIDLITDRSNITKLYETLAPSLYSPTVPCRFDMKLMGNCVLFFSRVEENRQDATQDNSSHHAFGLDFKDSFTRPVKSFTTGYFSQINRVKFGDFQMLVRFGADCVEAAEDEPLTSPGAIFNFQEVPGMTLKVFPFGTGGKDKRFIELRTRRRTNNIPRQVWFKLYISGISRFIMVPINDEGDIINDFTDKETEIITETTGGLNNKYLHVLHNFLGALIEFIQGQGEGKTFSLIWLPSNEKSENPFPSIPTESRGYSRGRGNFRGRYQRKFQNTPKPKFNSPPAKFLICEATDECLCSDVSDYAKSLLLC